MFHSFSHQVCYLKLPKKSEGSANVQWSRLDHSFLVYWDPKQRPETSWVCSVKNHKTSFSLGEIFWEKFVGQPLGVHDVQFSHLLVPCFIGEIWTQTNWRISDLNPSIFQVFHPHVRDMHLPIPTGATWGCWGVSNHERRPAWPPVTAPTEKTNMLGAACVYRLGWWWKDVFENIMKKKQLTQNLESEHISRSSSFWVFLPWSFFGSKKELSLSSDIQETSGDVKEEVGFVFWLANRRKCLLTIWGMDLEKGGEFSSISFGSVVVETLSGRLFFSIGCDGLQ